MASIVAGGSRGGSKVFGSKPSTISNPSPVSDLRRVTPFYDEMRDLISGNILSGLSGELSPSVTQSVLDAANSRAVAGGFGGSGLGRNLGLRDLGLTSKGIQDLALNQALSFFGNQSKTATLDPSLQSQIDEFNSIVRASPDPTARANWEIEQANKIAKEAVNPAANLPFGSKSTPIPSGSASTSFRPLVDWGNKMSLGVQPYMPTYSTPGSTSFSGTRVDAPFVAPFVPTGNASFNPSKASIGSPLPSPNYDPVDTGSGFRNLFSAPAGTPDFFQTLADIGIDPSIYGGIYDPREDSFVKADAFDGLDAFEPLPF